MIEVHPYADRFPMLPADELQALADDIAANGQIHPIVLWTNPETGEQLLIDGRNRRAACELVDVEPKTEVFEGDPYIFIRSANNRRRQMTAGQQVAADAFALIDQGLRVNNRWKRGAITATGNSDSQRMTEAGVIWDEDPSMLQKVLAGSITLPAAYDDINKKRTARQQDEARWKTLETQAPDLLRLVTENKLTFTDAWNAYEGRIKKDRERHEADVKRYKSTAEAIRSLSSITGDWMQNYDDCSDDELLGSERYFTTDRLLEARTQLDLIIDWSKQR